jgi:hypothetical protein
MPHQDQTSETCHCGSPMDGSDHCPNCYCEAWESYCEQVFVPEPHCETCTCALAAQAARIVASIPTA